MSKISKLRACPATGREIKSAECGENRNSKYACPQTCAFNPLTTANFEQFVEAEIQLNDRLGDSLKKRLQDQPHLYAKLMKALFDDGTSTVVEGLMHSLLFVQPDSHGKTVAEQFTEEKMPGLKNDHRVLFEGRKTMHASLIEVREVIDEVVTRAVDLWNPGDGEFILANRDLAATAARFQVWLGFTYRLGAFRRLMAGELKIPGWGALTQRQSLEITLKHLGMPCQRA